MLCTMRLRRPAEHLPDVVALLGAGHEADDVSTAQNALSSFTVDSNNLADVVGLLGEGHEGDATIGVLELINAEGPDNAQNYCSIGGHRLGSDS